MSLSYGKWGVYSKRIARRGTGMLHGIVWRMVCLMAFTAFSPHEQGHGADPSRDIGQSIFGQAMGMNYRVEFGQWLDPKEVDSIATEVRNELDRLDSIFSLYRTDSELMRWNRNRHREWVEVTEDLYVLTASAQRFWQVTQGSYDPTLRPLELTWRFDTLEPDWAPPTPVAIESSLAKLGMDKIELRETPFSIRKDVEDIELDLNSLVEGWALQRLDSILKNHSLGDFLIELGGEFLGCGLNRSRNPWEVVVESPQSPHAGCWKIMLHNMSLSTSGNYRGGQTYKGQWYSNILNARTGYPVDSQPASISVLHASPQQADGWATALMTQKLSERRALAERHNLAVFSQFRASGVDKVWRTPTAINPIKQVSREGAQPGEAERFWRIVFVAVIALLLVWKIQQLVRDQLAPGHLG